MPNKTAYARQARYRCPIEGCQYVATRSNIWTHLQAKTYAEHGLDKRGARDLINSVELERVTPTVSLDTPAVRVVRVAGTDPASYESRMTQLVDCPQGCGAVTKRKRVYQHLESVHRIEHRAALRLGREAQVSESTTTRMGDRGKHGRPPARNKPSGMKVLVPNKGTQGVDFTMVDPAEIAIAVVQSQVNGTIQTSLLPDVVVFVDHTRELVGKLRASG